jgi:hypothetical protein
MNNSQNAGAGFSTGSGDYPKFKPPTIDTDEVKIRNDAREKFLALVKSNQDAGMSYETAWSSAAANSIGREYLRIWRQGNSKVLQGANHAAEKSRQAKFGQLLSERAAQFANESSADRWNFVATSSEGARLLSEMNQKG